MKQSVRIVLAMVSWSFWRAYKSLLFLWLFFKILFSDTFSGCDGTGFTWYCCSSSKPCGVAEGDCNYDDDCLGHLLCGVDNCLSLSLLKYSKYVDCCYDPFPGKQNIFFDREYAIIWLFSLLSPWLILSYFHYVFALIF